MDHVKQILILENALFLKYNQQHLCLLTHELVKIEFVIGPSGVRVLPLAAGRNEGGHYFRYFWFSCPYDYKTWLQHSDYSAISLTSPAI